MKKKKVHIDEMFAVASAVLLAADCSSILLAVAAYCCTAGSSRFLLQFGEKYGKNLEKLRNPSELLMLNC